MFPWEKDHIDPPWSKWETIHVGQWPEHLPRPDAMIRNNIYQVTFYEVNGATIEEGEDAVRLLQICIKRVDRAPRHDWRDFQRIKNELVGPEFDCAELYPNPERLVDTSNMFILYAVPHGFTFPGYPRRMVTLGGSCLGASQRSWPNETAPQDAVPLIELKQQYRIPGAPDSREIRRKAARYGKSRGRQGFGSKLTNTGVQNVGRREIPCTRFENENYLCGLNNTGTTRELWHYTIRRIDGRPIFDWRHKYYCLQDAMPGAEAIERYPPDSELVDTCNEYSLWVLPAPRLFPFGLMYRRVQEGNGNNFDQRPFEVGRRPPDALKYVPTDDKIYIIE